MNESRSTLNSPGADGERSAAIAAALSSGAMIAQHVAGKATRDALFLSNFELSTLPAAMVASAAVSTVAVLGVARAMTKYTPARVVPVLFGTSAVLFVAEWALSLREPRFATLAVYFHMAIFGATIVSAFWSLVNERFDPHTAKRLVGRIASGGTLGGVLGGLLAWRAAGVLSVPTMLALLGMMNLVALVGVRGLIPRRVKAEGRVDDAAPRQKPVSGLKVIGEVPYLRNLAGLVLLGAITQALLDYSLSARAQATYGKGEHLLAFFALFHMLVGVVAFFAQTLLSRRALERLGLAWTVATVSAVVVLGGTGAVFIRTFASVVLLRGSEAVVRNSIFRAAYELLFTPLPPEKKRPTKTLIDVGFDRIGTAIGSGIVMATTALLLAKNVDQVLFILCVALSVGSIALAMRLHGGYVSALESSMRSGVLKLDPSDFLDPTTRRTISETTVALDREKLLESIAELQRTRSQAPATIAVATAAATAWADPNDSVSAPSTVVVTEAETLARPDEVLDAIAALRSGEPARVRSVLSRGTPIEAALVPHVLRLLKNDALVRDALRALRRVATRSTGQLLDALLQPDEDVVVRRRVPRVLKVCASKRAVEGMMLAFADPSFAVREQCALALLEITQEHRELSPSKDAVMAVAARELALGNKGWETEPAPARDPSEDATEHAQGSSEPPLAIQEDRPRRGLQHVLTVLSLALEREPLEIAFRSLAAEDGVIRGTALEYLEVVLPPAIRDALWPLVDKKNLVKKSTLRSRNEIEGELLGSQPSLSVKVGGPPRQKS